MQKSFSKQYTDKDTEFYTTEETVLKLMPFLDIKKRYIEPFNRVGNSKIYTVLKSKGFDIVALRKDYDKSDDYEGRIIITNPPFISRGGLYSKMSKQADEMYLIMPRFSFNAYTSHRGKDKCRRFSDDWEKEILFPVEIFDTPTGQKKVSCVFTHWKRSESMAELKPCPFCEGVGLYLHQETEEQWLVVCLDCGASGPYAANDQKAIDAWNKRSK